MKVNATGFHQIDPMPAQFAVIGFALFPSFTVVITNQLLSII
jgi:hypothetical protein